jgi:hypothetical protein
LLHQQLGATAHERNLSFADEYGAYGHHQCRNATGNRITRPESEKEAGALVVSSVRGTIKSMANKTRKPNIYDNLG